VPENTAAEKAFYQSLRSGRFPHAVLLEGGTAESRRAAAAAFCSAWLCAGARPPCGVCTHCDKALRWIHPDVTVLADAEGKQIPVDSVRALVAQSIVRPGEAERRVFVVENAHRLTPQGQNALLKCVEEPPPNLCFLLTCPSRKELLPTIISRVTAYELPGHEREFSPEALEAAGKIAAALADNDEWGVLAATAPFDKAKPLLQESLRALKELLREGVLGSVGAIVPDRPPDSANAPPKLSGLGPARLTQLIECVQSLERDLERNANLSLLRARIPAIMFS